MKQVKKLMDKSYRSISRNVKKVDVYKTIKNAIQFLELKPGSVINEINLATELGVSRTPIREALLRLADELLIEIYPQRGTYVTKIDLFLAKEMALLRHILETEVCLDLCRLKADISGVTAESMFFMKQAVDKDDLIGYLQHDDAFHCAIFKFAGHELIWNVIANTRAHYIRLLMLDMAFPHILEESYQQHQDYIRLIGEGDEESLLKLLTVHHDHYYMAREEQIKEKYSDFIV